MVLNYDFARSVKSTFESFLAMSIGGHDYPVIERNASSRPQESSASRDSSSFYCGAVVLLSVIRQRSVCVLSGEDVDHCEREWESVYLS